MSIQTILGYTSHSWLSLLNLRFSLRPNKQQKKVTPIDRTISVDKAASRGEEWKRFHSLKV